jgi:hypothetical protein
MMTFIVKGRCEVQFPDNPQKAKVVGTWVIRDNRVQVEVPDLPKLNMSMDSVDQDGDPHDRLRDKGTGISVVKI